MNLLSNGVLAAIAATSPAALAQVPPGYPADYAQTVAAAKKEAKVVHSALGTKAAQPLVKDFYATYPDINVEYNDMNLTDAAGVSPVASIGQNLSTLQRQARPGEGGTL